MTIYSTKRTRSTFYRKIYEDKYGPIPHDEEGRSYDIHHLDGNDKNNDITNLAAVTIQEHYRIHYSQGDWAACLSISKRLSVSPAERSELARKNAASQIAKGIHPWQNSERQRQKALLQVAEGRHPWQSSEKTRELNLKRVAEGTHNWLGGDATRKQIANGTHTSQIIKTCQHCNKTISSAMHSRWHGAKCKNKDN
jgi:hypothetical protein